MKKTYLSIICGLIWFSASAQTQITLNTDLAKTKINKHIYGHFAEHLGRCIYGGMYVGESNTKIPHTAGVRNDVIAALKDLKVPNLRWPGGCFADAYQWKDGIGPKANRPKMVNVWWGGVTEDNSFGTHDFLDLCERIGAEPYLAGNVGSGSVKDLADWVSYVNQPDGSPMSDLRKKNGRTAPWNVKIWGVGNEAWGCGGNMTADYYANVYRQYATFMNDITPQSKLYKVASGASSNDFAWTETLMKNIPHNMMSALALHHYSVLSWKETKGPSVGFTEAQYFKTMEEAWKMEEFVTKHSTIMDKYDPTKKIDLIVDEWGGWYETDAEGKGALYQQNTMRDAMIAGISLNIFNNHADRVRGANLAQIVNVLQAVILTNEEKMLLTPTYHVMKMYNVHQDATLVPINIESPMYEFQGKKIPALSVSASKDAVSTLNISLTNIDFNKPHDVIINLRGEDFNKVSGQILGSAKINDFNSFEQPNSVSIKEFNGAKLEKGILKLTVPAYSVLVLNLKK